MFALKQLGKANKFIFKTAKVQSVHKLSQTSETIEVDLNGEVLKFPHVWLRDNCQCEQCFHPSARSRIIDWSNFNLDIKPKHIVAEQNSVTITWNDGHSSKYNIDWLKFRSFSPERKKHYDNVIYKAKKIIWEGSQFEEVNTKHNYNEILKSDEALYNWLDKLSAYGVAVIENSPASDTAIEKVVDTIGFTKRTHYGVKFIVQHVANTSNVAYLSNKLQMHTDLPYYEYVPGVNLLHCLVQTESRGGENLLADCHYTANYMKQHHPEEYRLLTETEVEWSDVGTEDGNEFLKLYRSPVICLDKHNEITRINFSVPQRGSYFPGPIHNVQHWYRAHALFFELNHKFSAKFKTKKGDILVFDNMRLLHGRNAYEDSNNNVRKLIGAYLDWDEIYSRLRCLKVKLGHVKGF